MLALLRRQKDSRRHPSPLGAVLALEEGECLYHGFAACSGPPTPISLRPNGDANVLVCNAHYGGLRKVPARDLDRLEAALRQTFAHRLVHVDG
jgi:hypothetical protein